MVDETERQPGAERSAPRTGSRPDGGIPGRARRIDCGPTDEERADRSSRSGRGRREKDTEPTGRRRRLES